MLAFNIKECFPEVKKVIYVDNPADATSPCSKDLLSRMIMVIQREHNANFTKLLLSKEDFEDIRGHHLEQEGKYKEIHDWVESNNKSPLGNITLQLDERLAGTGNIVGLTDVNWFVVVGETGRYNNINEPMEV